MNAELPCQTGPCPHGGVCCIYGVDLDPEEAEVLIQRYGSGVLTLDRTRTAVWEGTCIFHSDLGCALHGLTCYPKVCRAFPYDGYEGDPCLCPEVKIR